MRGLANWFAQLVRIYIVEGDYCVYHRICRLIDVELSEIALIQQSTTFKVTTSPLATWRVGYITRHVSSVGF